MTLGQMILPRDLQPYVTDGGRSASRKPGRLDLQFRLSGDGRTVLAHKHREVPMMVLHELFCDEEMPTMPWVYIQSAGGPLVEGDRITQCVEMETGAFAHVETAAATQVAEMTCDCCMVHQRFMLQRDAYLEWLPEAVIPCRSARYGVQTELVVHPTATLFFAETMLCGRRHYGVGEVFNYDILWLNTSAYRPQGPLLFTDRMVVRPDEGCVKQLGVMSHFEVWANVLVLTPEGVADELFSHLQPFCLAQGDDASALSMARLPGNCGLLFRVLGNKSRMVRQMVRSLCAVVRQKVKGHALPPDFPWR